MKILDHVNEKPGDLEQFEIALKGPGVKNIFNVIKSDYASSSTKAEPEETATPTKKEKGDKHEKAEKGEKAEKPEKPEKEHKDKEHKEKEKEKEKEHKEKEHKEKEHKEKEHKEKEHKEKEHKEKEHKETAKEKKEKESKHTDEPPKPAKTKSTKADKNAQQKAMAYEHEENLNKLIKSMSQPDKHGDDLAANADKFISTAREETKEGESQPPYAFHTQHTLPKSAVFNNNSPHTHKKTVYLVKFCIIS